MESNIGNLTSISAAADGMVCGINSAGEVFKYVGPPAPAKPPSGSYPWQPITGGHLTQISVGSANNTWGLDSKGNVYRVTASGLTLINGQTLDTISAAADGTVWGLREFVPYLCEQGPTAETPDNFGSGANYILGDPHRKILRDVRVTIEITEDLVTEPKEKDIKNYSPKFAFQLNANSSANPSAPEDTWIVWQQYIFGIGDVIQGAVNNWTAPALNSGNQTINSPAYTLVTLPTPNSVPAGYKLTFILGNDEAGNVTSVNFIVDDGEMEYPPVEIVLTSIPEVTSAELAPIVALELNLVGPGNLQTTRFRSGAGTITYSSSTTLTAQNAIPLCAALGKNAPTTGESSNSVYGLLPSLPASTLVQSFGWSNP